MVRIRRILTEKSDIAHFIFGFGTSLFKYLRILSVYFHVVAVLGYLIFFLYQEFENENKIEGVSDMVEFFCGYVLGNILFN
jgi:hypothetical protein